MKIQAKLTLPKVEVCKMWAWSVESVPTFMAAPQGRWLGSDWFKDIQRSGVLSMGNTNSAFCFLGATRCEPKYIYFLDATKEIWAKYFYFLGATT